MQFRRAMKDLGTDISKDNSEKLISMYGYNQTISIHNISDLIKKSTTASPTHYFWLKIDPHDNGVRMARPKWNRFGKAGMITPIRLAHYGIGIISLYIGTIDLIDYTITLGAPQISYHDAFLHCAIHTSVAILSLPRFKYGWDKENPFKLWLPTARDANMWPSFIIFAWYTIAFCSNLVLPDYSATVKMTDPWFQYVTLFVIATMFYTTSRNIWEDNKLYTNSVSNVIVPFLTFHIYALSDALRVIILAHSEVYAQYIDIVASNPQFSQIYIGMSIQTPFLGNLLCALSSAEHFGAVTKDDIKNIQNFFAITPFIITTYALFSLDDNYCMRLIDIIWKGICSFTLF
jgi:hypothetical protein